MSLHSLNLARAKRQLLEIALIEGADERTKSLEFWFRQHVRDYHVRLHNTLDFIEQIGKERFENYLYHQKREAAFKLADAMLRDKVMSFHELTPDEQERKDADYGKTRPWWLYERQWQMDVATFALFY